MRRTAFMTRIQQWRLLMPYFIFSSGRLDTESMPFVTLGVASQMLQVCVEDVPVTASIALSSTIVMCS